MAITELYEKERRFQKKENEQLLSQIRLLDKQQRAQKVWEEMSKSEESLSMKEEIMVNL